MFFNIEWVILNIHENIWKRFNGKYDFKKGKNIAFTLIYIRYFKRYFKHAYYIAMLEHGLNLEELIVISI